MCVYMYSVYSVFSYIALLSSIKMFFVRLLSSPITLLILQNFQNLEVSPQLKLGLEHIVANVERSFSP